MGFGMHFKENMIKSMLTWSSLKPRAKISALLAKRRADRTEASKEGITVRTVRRKFINVS